jgi:hypothetical protein
MAYSAVTGAVTGGIAQLINCGIKLYGYEYYFTYLYIVSI